MGPPANSSPGSLAPNSSPTLVNNSASGGIHSRNYITTKSSSAHNCNESRSSSSNSVGSSTQSSPSAISNASSTNNYEHNSNNNNSTTDQQHHQQLVHLSDQQSKGSHQLHELSSQTLCYLPQSTETSPTRTQMTKHYSQYASQVYYNNNSKGDTDQHSMNFAEANHQYAQQEGRTSPNLTYSTVVNNGLDQGYKMPEYSFDGNCNHNRTTRLYQQHQEADPQQHQYNPQQQVPTSHHQSSQHQLNMASIGCSETVSGCIVQSNAGSEEQLMSENHISYNYDEQADLNAPDSWASLSTRSRTDLFDDHESYRISSLSSDDNQGDDVQLHSTYNLQPGSSSRQKIPPKGTNDFNNNNSNNDHRHKLQRQQQQQQSHNQHHLHHQLQQQHQHETVSYSTLTPMGNNLHSIDQQNHEQHHYHRVQLTSDQAYSNSGYYHNMTNEDQSYDYHYQQPPTHEHQHNYDHHNSQNLQQISNNSHHPSNLNFDTQLGNSSINNQSNRTTPLQSGATIIQQQRSPTSSSSSSTTNHPNNGGITYEPIEQQIYSVAKISTTNDCVHQSHNNVPIHLINCAHDNDHYGDIRRQHNGYTNLQPLAMDQHENFSNQVSTTTAPTCEPNQLNTKARALKGRRGRPRKKGQRSKNKVNGKLWEFIRDLLLNERTNPSFIRWERREDGVFKFVQSDKVAKMWGERKQNPKMTYEKLSRAMRYYYKSKVLLPVFGRRLVYKFGPNATGWLPN